jgi:hypothetical protein
VTRLSALLALALSVIAAPQRPAQSRPAAGMVIARTTTLPAGA